MSKKIRIPAIIISAFVMVLISFVMSDTQKAEAKVFPKSFLEKAFDEVPETKGIYTPKADEHIIRGAAEKPSVAWDENYTADDLRMMTCIIFCEANSMSPEAMLGVANVIINRKNAHGDWEHVTTIEEVIYDHKWGVQFSPTKGSPSSMDKAFEVYDHLEDYKDNWKYQSFLNCMNAAKAAFCGERSIPTSYLFFNGHIDASKEKCEQNGKPFKIMDGHIYY